MSAEYSPRLRRLKAVIENSDAPDTPEEREAARIIRAAIARTSAARVLKKYPHAYYRTSFLNGVVTARVYANATIIGEASGATREFAVGDSWFEAYCAQC